MTCKDCLHYEACDRLADAKLDRGIMQIRTSVCKCFSDKSKCIILPCKVGDQVFSIIIVGGELTIVADHVSGFIIVGGTVDVITNWYSDGGEWGYNIFPTQEEARKEAERRKN